MLGDFMSGIARHDLVCTNLKEDLVAAISGNSSRKNTEQKRGEED